MKKLKFLPIFLILLFLNACASKYDELDLEKLNKEKLTELKVNGEKLYISGIINERAYFDIKKVLENNPQLKIAILDNIEGSIDDDFNLKASLLIHKAKLDTFVPKNSEIYSGAVDMFCAGKERIVQKGAIIGVHSWGDDYMEGSKISKSDPIHKIYLDYFNQVACSSSFYWYTLEAANADDIHIMNEKELFKYKVATQIID